MVFSSILFIFCFLPLFLILYHIVNFEYKNWIILLSSIIFYAWGAPDFVYIALLSIVLDFYIVKNLYFTKVSHKKLFLWSSIILNVGLLLYFKYSNFFIENVNTALSGIGQKNIQWTKIVLPIGLSFFTFQKISYTVDVYRGVNKPLSSLKDYAVFILLFPQLIAGPIVRYKEIASQLIYRETNNFDDRIYGIYRFAIGLGKKVLIANVLGAEADSIFTLDASEISSSTAWFGIICYTFQIYFDFSGYSDMAIGLGKLMGFKFPENFNSPYISQNITEFWRRWHITLGSWMRDYLYIPLGGNRVASKNRIYLNLWIVFLISGLWHGASWNFVLWGAYHGIFLIFDRIFLTNLTSNIGSGFRIVLTFFIVVLGWVLFRAVNLSHAIEYYVSLFKFDFSSIEISIDKQLIAMLTIAIILSTACIFKSINKTYSNFVNGTSLSLSIIKSSISFLLILISVSFLSGSDFNPFIYFRF